jgi:hypothetical protein
MMAALTQVCRQGNGIRKKDIASLRRTRIAHYWSQHIGKPDRVTFDETTGRFRPELHPAEDMHNG